MVIDSRRRDISFMFLLIIQKYTHWLRLAAKYNIYTIFETYLSNDNIETTRITDISFKYKIRNLI